jgi:hypothetical protein
MTAKDIPVLAKKYPFTAICGSLALLLAIAYFYRQSALPEAESLLAQKTAESRRLKANITNSVQLKEHVAALEAGNAKVTQRLVRAGDLATNQQYFYKIESETGVKLTDLRPGASVGGAAGKATPAKGLYSPVPYSCAVQGTYSQLLDFLQKIENGEHFQRILSANVSLNGSSPEDAVSADPILTLVIAIEFLGQS